MLLASTIIWQTQQATVYDLHFKLYAGEIAITPEVQVAEEILLRTLVATTFLFYSCVWSVKIGMLIFFRRLEQRVRAQRIWWWCVLCFTIGQYNPKPLSYW